MKSFLTHSVSAEAISDLESEREILDSVIDFHCEVLKDRFEGKKLFFVRPPLVQFIQRASVDQARLEVAGLNLKQYKMVFFPLSDLKAEHGHFSLLIWRPRAKRMAVLHLDSANQRNHAFAVELFKKLAQLFQISGNLTEITSPSQTNSRDCGVYVMAMYDYIATNESISKDLLKQISPFYIKTYRRVLAHFITNPESYECNWENALSEINSITNEEQLQHQRPT